MVSLVNLGPNCSFEEDIKMLMIHFYELLSGYLFWGYSYTSLGGHMDNAGSLKIHACGDVSGKLYIIVQHIIVQGFKTLAL